MVKPHHLVVSLSDVGADDIHFLGEKAAGMKDGFAIMPSAYFKFLRDNNLEIKIRHLIGSINFERDESLQQVSRHIKNLMTFSKIPDSIFYKVVGHYIDLGSSKSRIYMSIISGDADQRRAFEEKETDIEGESVLLDTVRNLWGRVFEPNLIAYRNRNMIDHLKTGASIVVQKI